VKTRHLALFFDREVVLTIGKLGAGQERYYLDQVAQGAEDYYAGEGEAQGQWKGHAARELGRSGEVGADQLRAMLTGNDLASGEPLLGMRGVPSGRGAVPGFDLTFSAPKSVSQLGPGLRLNPLQCCAAYPLAALSGPKPLPSSRGSRQRQRDERGWFGTYP
jgi:TrwC relaxase